MNKLTLIAILLISTIAFSQETKNTNKGTLKFESESIDYGKITQNSDGNRVFKFKNIGDSPVIISTVKGSCGCTVATKPNEPIMPGETAEIGVKYATNRLGGFSKTITVLSNASIVRHTLRIKGIVVKDSEQIKKTVTSVQ